jgi:putative flippase GtrA
MKEFILQFFAPESSPLVQFLKYAIVGGIATAVHITVFHLAGWKLFPSLQNDDWFVKMFKIMMEEEDDVLRSKNSMKNNWIAFFISNLVCYILNILWVFDAGKYPWYLEIVMFYAVSAISIALGTFLMGWLIRKYGMITTYAFCANLFTSLAVNYAMRKFLIFNG